VNHAEQAVGISGAWRYDHHGKPKKAMWPTRDDYTEQ
jgi:hypothetical protein